MYENFDEKTKLSFSCTLYFYFMFFDIFFKIIHVFLLYKVSEIRYRFVFIKFVLFW